MAFLHLFEQRPINSSVGNAQRGEEKSLAHLHVAALAGREAVYPGVGAIFGLARGSLLVLRPSSLLFLSNIL